MAKLHYVNNRLVGTQPTAPNDYVTMDWVQQYVIGKVKLPVRAISRANLAGTYAPGVAPAPATRGTFTLGANGILTVDGVPLAVGDRLLVAGQTDGTQNGIYVVTVAGDASTAAVLERADDWDTDDQIFTGVRINVKEGTLYARTTWSLTTTGTLAIGSTALTFVQVGATSGATKYAETITGDGLLTAFPITHNIGSTDVMVQVFDLVTNAEVGTDIIITDADNVTIGFDSAPDNTRNFRVIALG